MIDQHHNLYFFVNRVVDGAENIVPFGHLAFGAHHKFAARHKYVDEVDGFIEQTAAIAAQMPGVPVQLMWTREQELRHDF